MTSLDYAVACCQRTLRRRAAGEHQHSVDETIVMWLGEWGLRGQPARVFVDAMRVYALELEPRPTEPTRSQSRQQRADF